MALLYGGRHGTAGVLELVVGRVRSVPLPSGLSGITAGAGDEALVCRVPSPGLAPPPEAAFPLHGEGPTAGQWSSRNPNPDLTACGRFLHCHSRERSQDQLLIVGGLLGHGDEALPARPCQGGWVPSALGQELVRRGLVSQKGM